MRTFIDLGMKDRPSEVGHRPALVQVKAHGSSDHEVCSGDGGEVRIYGCLPGINTCVKQKRTTYPDSRNVRKA